MGLNAATGVNDKRMACWPANFCIQIAVESMSSGLMSIPSFGLDIHRAVKSEPHPTILVQLHCHYISETWMKWQCGHRMYQCSYSWLHHTKQTAIHLCMNELMNNYTPRCETKDQYKYTGQRKCWTSNLNVNGMACLLQELSAPTSFPSPATVPTPKLPKLKLPFVCITTEQVILHVHACCCFLYTCDIIHKTKQY